MKHFNGRLREAARLAYHMEYGANIPAMMRSGQKYAAMALTPDEERKVNLILDWMVDQVQRKDRWF